MLLAQFFALIAGGSVLSYLSFLRSNDAFGRPIWSLLVLIPLLQIIFVVKPPFDQNDKNKPTLRQRVSAFGLVIITLAATVFVITRGPEYAAESMEDLKVNYDNVSVKDLALMKAYDLSDRLPLYIDNNFTIKDITADDDGLLIHITTASDALDPVETSDLITQISKQLCRDEDIHALFQKKGMVRFRFEDYAGRREPQTQEPLMENRCN
jgi:hypothetical protein